MPPRIRSRYSFTFAFDEEDENRKQLSEREPVRFRQFPDSRIHTVKEGDSLYFLAGRFFRPLERPAGLWWVIADFQPVPVVDPTLTLEPGSQLIIPSVPVVLDVVLGEKQRRRT